MMAFVVVIVARFVRLERCCFNSLCINTNRWWKQVIFTAYQMWNLDRAVTHTAPHALRSTRKMIIFCGQLNNKLFFMDDSLPFAPSLKWPIRALRVACMSHKHCTCICLYTFEWSWYFEEKTKSTKITDCVISIQHFNPEPRDQNYINSNSFGCHKHLHQCASTQGAIGSLVALNILL